jgi:hypothetical protein
MSAEIDGTTWIANCIQAASWIANTLSIVGTNGTDTVTLGAVTTELGTIDLTTGAAYGSVTRLSTGATWTTGAGRGGGILTLTRVDFQGAAGTFSFSAPPAPGSTATGTKVVSNGMFNVRF